MTPTRGGGKGRLTLTLAGVMSGQYIGGVYALVFLLGPLFFGVLSILLGQDNNWDLRNYHYYNPYAFLHGRIGFDYAPAQIQSFLNPVADLLFYFLVTHLKPMWVGFVMGALHGLNFGLIFAIAYALLSALSIRLRLGLAFLCAAVGMYAPVTIAELGATQNDLFTSLFVLSSTLIVVRWLSGMRVPGLPTERSRLIVAGLLLGIGTGLKLTALIYALGFGLALLTTKKEWRAWLKVAGMWGLGLTLGLILSRGYWMVTMWTHYASPLFPFYNQIFRSSYYDLINFSDGRFLPRSLLEGLLYPFHFFTNSRFTYLSNAFRDSRYAIIYILLIVYLLTTYFRWTVAPRKGKEGKKRGGGLELGSGEKFILALYIISYIIWQVKFSIVRYLTPVEHLGPLVIVILIFHIFKSGQIRAIVLGVLLLAVVGVVKQPVFERLPWSSSFFETEAPRLEDPDRTIVIIAGRRPWAYLVPAFPPGVRFVRVGGNFTRPDRPTRMRMEMWTLLQSHRGPIYLLSRVEHLRQDVEILRAYQLYLSSPEYKLVKSKHERPGLCLWPVVRREM